ncbi:vernalization insensitive 3 [Sesbania bispinosa]|nr:vernalization insensitive 3 [Sesbania bispinosa]
MWAWRKLEEGSVQREKSSCGRNDDILGVLRPQHRFVAVVARDSPSLRDLVLYRVALAKVLNLGRGHGCGRVKVFTVKDIAANAIKITVAVV